MPDPENVPQPLPWGRLINRRVGHRFGGKTRRRLAAAQRDALEIVVGEKHRQQHQPQQQKGDQQGAVAAGLDGHQQQQAAVASQTIPKRLGMM